MWILGSFGDPREFSHHSKAVLSNLTEPDFHLQPLLLKAVWFANKCSVSIFPTFTNADTNKCRPQSTAWEEAPIFQEHTFPSVPQLAGGSGQWLCPSSCPLVLVSNAGFQPRIQCRCRIATTAKSFLTYHHARWLTCKTSDDSDMTLGTFPHCYTDGNQFTCLRDQFRELITPNLHGEISFQAPAWVFVELHQRLTSHQPQHSCLRREFMPPFENFCSPQRKICWLQLLCRFQ